MRHTRFLSIAASPVLLATLMVGPSSAKGPVCGGAQDDTWMAPDELVEKLEGMGYTIENMVISDGNCYEMSGMNAQGDSVMTYLDPKTGDLVPEELIQQEPPQ